MPHQDRLNIAVFIDFDNIEIGVKSTLGQQFDVGTILDAIKERGEVVTKIAYADWTRAGEYSRTLTQHAIRLVQRNLTPGGDKNGADINLALDALEMAFTHPHINAYVIVGGDSDFLSLVEKLKQYDKKVFVVGGRAFTSVILQRNCHEFIAYENLHGVRKTAAKIGRPMPAAAANSPIAQAFPIVRRALKILADREVSPQTGLLKSTLLQLDSTFSERNYGASSFLDFVEKLSQASLVQLKHAGRSVMVELNNQFEETEAAAPRPVVVAEAGAETSGAPALAAAPAVAVFGSGGYGEPRRSDGADAPGAPNDYAGVVQPLAPAASSGEPRRSDSGGGFRPIPEQPSLDVPRATEPPADGVKRVAEVLNASTTARWPMYLRNVKQLLRAADAAFDERRYGFSGLVELVRACQKDGLVRLERDRRGGLRVFPGPALQPQRGAETAPVREVPTEINGNVQIESERPRPIERPAWEAAAAAAAESQEAGDLDADLLDNEPMPTSDPTAELLGTGARRKRVSRVHAPTPAPTPARRTAKTAARKPAAATAARKPRAKKKLAIEN
ncbi:MAG: NYN domain-containing protein [Acidobacteriota bacterium]